MDHFVVYHNTERMGQNPPPNGELLFWTAKSPGLLAKGIGNTVWVIQGVKARGKTSYTLIGAYIMASFEPVPDDPGLYLIQGNVGIDFDPAIQLDELPWFPALKKNQGNFGLGFNRVADDSLVHSLVTLRERYNSDHFGAINIATQSQSLLEATREAFPGFTASQVQVLHALLFAPDHSSSAGQLCTLLGLSAVVQVNAAIGQAGRKVFKISGHHPDDIPEGEFQWWTVLATGQRSDRSNFVWTLRPEVAAALEACGLREIGPHTADEAGTENTSIEGAVRKILVNAYERNPVARARCLEHYGHTCAACGVNFGKLYGQVAEGFIHVHHLRQLSDIGQEYEVDPILDLRPVCPNCHAVIHMTDPPYTIEQVQALLSRHDA
jgi:hypothetical protein